MGQTSVLTSLERIGEEVDWERFAFLVEGVYSADEGRPSYPPLMMVKVLLRSSGMSDPQMEEALGDRISFRRFVGLGLQDETPDYSTTSRFRTELVKHGLIRSSKELEVQLDKRGLVEGGDVDGATLVEAQAVHPSLRDGSKSSTGLLTGIALRLQGAWVWMQGRGWCWGC